MIDFFERIKANNPWWGSVGMIKEDSLLLEFASQHYRYFHPLLKTFPLEKDAVITVRGPRRVGKSTLVRLLIKRLLVDEKLPKEAVFFFPCDRVRDFDDLFEIIKSYLDFARPRVNTRLYLFLDEISFVRDWQRAIKEMVDSGLLKHALVFITGSSILDLKFGSEYLAGRRGSVFPADIFYFPLSFKEFVTLVKPKILQYGGAFSLSYHLPLVRKLFHDFLLTGGFPKTINEYYQLSRIENSTYETFLTWFENDLHKTGRSETRAYELIFHILRTITTRVSFTALGRDAAFASHFAVQEYIDIFEKMFILFPLPALLVEQNRQDPKKNKKIYFADPFIFNALILKAKEQMENPFLQSRRLIESSLFPLLVENAVASHLRRMYSRLFWGKIGKKEIDFVGRKKGIAHCFEVKYQEKIDYADLPDIPRLTVLSKKTFCETPIKTLPAELFLLEKRNV